MSLEKCKLCNQESTPWVHINGHICVNCYANSKRLYKLEFSWVDVKDALPLNGDYLLLTDGYQPAMGFFNHARKEFIQVNTWKNLTDTVTHWAYFPKLPNNKNRDE